MKTRISTITEFNTVDHSKTIVKVKCTDCLNWVPQEQGVVDIGMFQGYLAQFIICKTCNDQFLL